MRLGLADVVARNPSILTFDQFDHFCEASVCDFFQTEPLLRDTTHLSVAGSSMLAAAFAHWASEHLPALQE